MSIQSSEIVLRLCRVAAQNNFPLGAVRVQKLIYLMECEFYRWERTRLTEEKWIYYHYGPWSPTLDATLREQFQIDPEILADGRTINSIRYSESEFQRMPDRFNDFVTQGIFERIIDEWFSRPLQEILDFVYFYTAPMQNIARREQLDFSVIPAAKDERDPINPYALGDKRKKELLKKSMELWRASIRGDTAVNRLPVDEAMVEATESMNAAETTPELSGEIIITGEVARRLLDGD